MVSLVKIGFFWVLVAVMGGAVFMGCSKSATNASMQSQSGIPAKLPPLQINDGQNAPDVQIYSGANLPLPEIIYDRVYDETPIPINFPQAFQAQLIYALRVYPRPQIKSIHFHFFHYINEERGETSLRYPPSDIPRHLFNLKVSVLVHGQWRGVEKDIAIPTGDTPPYQYAFDEIISMILNL